MAPFTTLPNDLLLHLSDYIEPEDRANLRLTCDAFADIFATQVLRSFVIHAMASGKEGKRPALDILNWMAGGYSVHKGRVEAIRQLRVSSLSPANYLKGGEDDDTAVVEECLKFDLKIMEILERALVSLPNVRTLSWSPYSKDPNSSHEIVARALSQYPQLDDFSINTADLSSPVLMNFKNLTYLSYNAWKTVPRTVVDSFTQAVIHSPKLKKLSFTAAVGSDDLDHVARQWMDSDTGVTTTLQSLILNRCIPPLTILPSLQHLSRLSILCASEVGKDEEDRRRLFQDLWLEITTTRLRLRNISVDRVPDALVDYLASYHGLERFSLHNHYREEDDAIEKIYLTAGRFYDEALSNHFSTLEYLNIALYYDDQWSLRPAYQPTIAKCVNLRHLAVGFEGGLQDESSPMHVLLDTITRKCLLLKDLTIHKPVSLNRTSQPGGHESYYINKAMWENTQHAIFTWVAPAHSNVERLPKISLSGSYAHYYYVARGKCDGGPIKYFERSVGDYFHVTENTT